MKPTKTLETEASIWFRYLGQEIRFDIRRDLWSCDCVGNGVFLKDCKHIRACREIL